MTSSSPSAPATASHAMAGSPKKRTACSCPVIIDLLLNSAMFVYVGSIIPWYAFEPQIHHPVDYTLVRLWSRS